MPMTPPSVLALDFDGVLCDGLKEYFKTAWMAYCKLWQPSEKTPPAGLAESFYRLRPVVETGWEMPLVLKAVVDGLAETELLADWPTIAKRLVSQYNLDPATLMAEVDGLRDRWIADDLHSWLAKHRFYPGVSDRLKAILQTDTHVAIISTKEGRFIQQLLQQEGIDLTDLQILGKEVKRSKANTLKELIQIFPTATFWFVEDRLKTLQTIQQHPELAEVALFLADWGYNTSGERLLAEQDPDLHLLSLSQFNQDFSSWINS
ncbi:HAD family hydrolase [Leptodesmis sichuanensis A121]|nr:HAD family hydrolase [Leptodesmis sichuanensis]UIE39943.1 HAD family hydrolase [Leptodesmis sichuanensis A121]